MLVSHTIGRYADAQAALSEAQNQFQRGAYRDAMKTSLRGRAQVQGLPGGTLLARELAVLSRRARRAQAAVDLHAVTDSLRFLAGADHHSLPELVQINAHCRAAWDAREIVASTDGPLLEAATEVQISADLLDLALLWTSLKQRLAASSSTNNDSDDIKAMLSEVEKIVRRSPALTWAHESLGGKTAVGQPNCTPGSWEQLSYAQSLLRSGELGRAGAQLEEYTAIRPNDFWAHFYGGVCAFRREAYPEAAHSFTVAIALQPNSAECFYNRALAFVADKKPVQALTDYDRTLKLSPNLGAAALNRGVLHYQAGRYGVAKADLEKALLLNANAAAAHYNLALVHLSLNDRRSAMAHCEKALAHDATHEEARALHARLAKAPSGPPANVVSRSAADPAAEQRSSNFQHFKNSRAFPTQVTVSLLEPLLATHSAIVKTGFLASYPSVFWNHRGET